LASANPPQQGSKDSNDKPVVVVRQSDKLKRDKKTDVNLVQSSWLESLILSHISAYSGITPIRTQNASSAPTITTTMKATKKDCKTLSALLMALLYRLDLGFQSLLDPPRAGASFTVAGCDCDFRSPP
jgi:hypothetical protein